MKDKLELHTAGALFELRARGMLARLFMLSRVEPTEDEKKMLYGTKQLTLRDMAEIAYRLGYHLELTYCDQEDDEQTSEGDQE